MAQDGHEELRELEKRLAAVQEARAEQALRTDRIIAEFEAKKAELCEHLARERREREQCDALLRAESRRWVSILEDLDKAEDRNTQLSEVKQRQQKLSEEEKHLEDESGALESAQDEVRRLIEQHADGEARLIEAELAQLASGASDDNVGSDDDYEVLLQRKLEIKAKLEALESASVASTVVQEENRGNAGSEVASARSVPSSRGSTTPPVPHSQPSASEEPSAEPAATDSQPASAQPNKSEKGDKGKGKGKGPAKGKGPPPKAPPPSAKAAAPGGKGAAKGGLQIKKSNLITLHWKVRPETEEVRQPAQDRLQAMAEELVSVTRIADGSKDGENDSRSEADAATLDPAVNVFKAPEGDDSSGECDDIPSPMIEVYFKRRAAAVKLDSGESKKVSLLDQKRLDMLGIWMRKHMMANRGSSDEQAVLSLKRAVLRCDYNVVKQEGLSMLHQVLRQQKTDGNKISEYVKANGEEALQKLQHPWHHRLVFEIMKVPQVEERLECMLFETAFEDNARKCEADIDTLCQALHMLSGKKDVLKQLFTTVLRLGQSLNKGCRAPQIERGFTLSSLDKVLQAKSSASPKHNMLHFALAMMPAMDAAAIFTEEDVLLLSRAKVMKSFTVYQDCNELVQGFHAVRAVCENSSYKSTVTGEQIVMERRRKTLAMKEKAPETEIEASIDTDDWFHECVKAFVDGNMNRVSIMSRACLATFCIYKELAVFFEDVNSVYPPPKDDKDTRVDLVVILHKFAEQVRQHQKDVDQDDLRSLLAATPEQTPASEDQGEPRAS
eukprot:TRINITY_DN604_c3_g1_i1.p1 TRINITY_DN604_c3_g1~~TRINITY_DN604_c3_g1_i1.p1  ORF type:complete len:784 (-),score=203.30 TRINITY_DN604_c3_g1_i1:46-2397(-)